MERLHKQGFSVFGEDVKKRLRLLSEERLAPREEKTCVFVRHFFGKKMAERAGFEPAVEFPLRQFSKLLLSATQPSLRCFQHGI